MLLIATLLIMLGAITWVFLSGPPEDTLSAVPDGNQGPSDDLSGTSPRPARRLEFQPVQSSRTVPVPPRTRKEISIPSSGDRKEIEKWVEDQKEVCVQQILDARLEQAQACLKMVLAVAPEDAQSHLMLGIAQAKQGKRSEAYWSYLKYLELDPEGAKSAQVDKVLRDYETYMTEEHGPRTVPTGEQDRKPIRKASPEDREEYYRYLGAMRNSGVRQAAEQLLASTVPGFNACLADETPGIEEDSVLVVVILNQDGSILDFSIHPPLTAGFNACFKPVLEDVDFPGYQGNFSEEFREYIISHFFSIRPRPGESP